MNKVLKPITWAEFDQAVEHLSSIICRSDITEQTVLYGQPRGGLCLATALSHRTGIPLTTDLTGVCVQDVLWIDDICETGTAFNEFCAKHGTPLYGYTWFISKELNTNFEFPVYGKDVVNSDEWLVFPWECMNKARSDCAEYQNKRKGEK